MILDFYRRLYILRVCLKKIRFACSTFDFRFAVRRGKQLKTYKKTYIVISV